MESEIIDLSDSPMLDYVDSLNTIKEKRDFFKFLTKSAACRALYPYWHKVVDVNSLNDRELEDLYLEFFNELMHEKLNKMGLI